jgi:hypothetical protein
VHLESRSRSSIAVHWGTFHLTFEPPLEPRALLRSAIARREKQMDAEEESRRDSDPTVGLPGKFSCVNPGKVVVVIP